MPGTSNLERSNIHEHLEAENASESLVLMRALEHKAIVSDTLFKLCS